MEGTQGKLCTRFTDGLGGNDAHRLSLGNHSVPAEVPAVALCTETLLGFAGKDRTDLHRLDGKGLDVGGQPGCYLRSCFADEFIVSGS